MRVEKPAGGGDEFDRYVEAAVEQERRVWMGRVDAALAETRAVREQNERLFQVLAGVMEVLPPDPVEDEGKTFVFQDPDANRTLRILKTRILGIRDAVVAIRNARLTSLELPRLHDKHPGKGAA